MSVDKKIKISNLSQIDNNKGFSLVELMIVVAIIGILTSVAIPNYKRFQMKARQGEAKGQLSAVYMAEKSFQQEWGQYFGDFRDIGYAPEGSLTYYVTLKAAGGVGVKSPPASVYTYGGGAGADASPTKFDTTTYCAIANSNCVETDYITGTNNSSLVTATQAQASAPAATTFTAAAGSDLDRAADTDLDIWTINQAKLLQNPSSDL